MSFEFYEIEEHFEQQAESVSDRLAEIAGRDAGKLISRMDVAAGVSPYSDESTYAARTYAEANGMHVTIRAWDQ
jgi:hypothetical protein